MVDALATAFVIGIAALCMYWSLRHRPPFQ